MLRKAIISVMTVALLLTGAVVGLTGEASAATSAAAGARAAAIPQQSVVQQLADSVAESLRDHGRKKLRKNNRLWQHGPSLGPGSSAHIVIRLASGAVLGENDIQFAEPVQDPHFFQMPLPNARKLLKTKKHPVLVADVTYYGPDGQVLVASRSTRI